MENEIEIQISSNSPVRQICFKVSLNTQQDHMSATEAAP